MVSEKAHLIVSGVARSGTTALGELLNSHPAICLGIERFKFQYLKKSNFSQALFERERFFDFRAEDTNLDPARRPAWQPVYDRIAKKWDGAELIGDKVPDLLPVLAEFIAQNSGYRYIIILRNLKDVALSWQKRADKSRDAWPAGKGFAAACESWGEQHRILHEIMRDRHLRKHVLLLDYDAMYQDPARTEAALLGFLRLASDPQFSKVLREHATFATNRNSRKVPRPHVATYKAVDQGPIRRLRKIAQEQAQTWSDTNENRDRA